MPEQGVKVCFVDTPNTQIELIEPLDDRASPYRDFLTATGGRGGLQHVSSWPSTATFDALTASLPILFEGRGGRTRFAYFDLAHDFGSVMEIADLSRGTRALFEHIRTAAAEWDGAAPFVRAP